MTISNNGWITLHRKIADHWLWDAKPFSKGQAWIDILLECNHSDRKRLFEGRLISTKRGQSSNSKKTWSIRWGWSISATRHFLNMLEKDKMIDTHNARVTTVITIINYDSYQLKQTSEEAQNDLGKTSEESHEDTNNNDNNEKNGKKSVLSAHTAYRLIHDKPPTQHSIMRVTQFCNEYGIESVLLGIKVMGDKSWHSADMLLKILKGDLPQGKSKDSGYRSTLEDK